MDKKKSLTKAGSTAGGKGSAAKRTAQKTAEKIASVKAEKKSKAKVKTAASRTITAPGGKASPLKAVEPKPSRKTKGLSKAPEGRKAAGEKSARPLSIGKSVRPEKKEVKKAPGRAAVSKTRTSPEKTAPKAEAAPKKEKKVAVEASKARKIAPAKTKGTKRERPKPVERPEAPVSGSRKADEKKTAAAYAAPPLREKKTKRSFDLRFFLPEEKLPDEEFLILPPAELPEEYGENELLLLEVDPSRIFASWEIKPEDIAGEAGRLVLRVYDVTGADLENIQGRRFFDIPVSRRVGSRFFDIRMQGREVVMEIGLLSPEGSFRAIKRSHRVSMPELQIFEDLGITGQLSDSGALIGY